MCINNLTYKCKVKNFLLGRDSFLYPPCGGMGFTLNKSIKI